MTGGLKQSGSKTERGNNMKKAITILMVISIMIGLCGCGKSQAVKDTEAAIKEIGDVTADSGRKITTAEKLYHDLEEKEKRKVENYDTLEYSREVYDALQRRDYYRAICLYAEHDDLNGVKTLMHKFEYGDDAIFVAVTDNNMIVSLSKLSLPGGATMSGSNQWFYYYTFPTGGGLPQRFGLYSDDVYDNLKDFTKAVEGMNSGILQVGEVLCSFDLS